MKYCVISILQMHSKWELTLSRPWVPPAGAAPGFHPCCPWIFTLAKVFECVDHNKLWKILKEMGIPNYLTCLLRKLYEGQEATELYMEQQTGSKSGKKYVKAVYCHPAYLTSMQSTSWEMLDWMKHKMESRLPWEISITSYTQMTPYGRKGRTKEPLDESERGEWKSWLKTQHLEN